MVGSGTEEDPYRRLDDMKASRPESPKHILKSTIPLS